MSISTILFHGTWAPFPFRERFFVWAEDAHRFKGKRGARRRRASHATRSRCHCLSLSCG